MLKFSLLPSSNLTVNDLRLALINYIIAKQNNQRFIITVKDLNKQESKDKTQDNIDILKKFAIVSDDTIYQSDNLKIYQNFAYKLLKDGKAFICFCESNSCKNNCLELSQEKIISLKEQKKEFVIRVKKPNKAISFIDEIKGKISLEIEEFLILNQNQIPTNNFACAIDDMLFNITIKAQNEALLKNSIEQIYIKELLEYKENIKYAHIPALLNGDILVKKLLQDGFLPDSIINYLILLTLKTPTDIFHLPDVIEWFDIKNIYKEPIKFDIEKLKELNKEHLKIIDNKKLSLIVGFVDSDIGKLLKLFLNSSSTINELENNFRAIFSKKDCSKKSIKKVAQIIQEAPMIDSFSEFKEYLKNSSNLDEKNLNEALNIILTSSKEPKVPLEKIYPLIKPYLLEVAQCQ